MKHVHLRVSQFDERGGADFCMYRYGVWRVDPNTQSLVVGRNLNRVHVPLVTIAHFSPIDGPGWCKQQEEGGTDAESSLPTSGQ